MPKAVITCPVCKKNRHDTNGCWFNAENKLREAVKMKSDEKPGSASDSDSDTMLQDEIQRALSRVYAIPH
jgi:hypothetical protein